MFTNNTSFIIDDFGDFRSDLFSDLGKMEFTLIPINDFLTIQTIRNNRDVHRRKNRIAKILAIKGLREHLKVIIGQLPNGETIVINGNTRKQCWLENLVDKPDFVIAQINYYNNLDEAKEEYYAIDSQNSVENASDKFTGAYRALNMDMQSKRLKGGSITNAIKDFMTIWPDNNIPKTPKTNDFYIDTALLLRDEILKLDSILHGIECDRGAKDDKAFKQANFLVVSLSFLKKYGIDNQRVIDGINLLFKGHMEFPGGRRKSDGISHIIKELKDEGSVWLPHGATRTGTREQLDFIFHCFQKWMDDEDMHSARRYERETSPYLTFFEECQLNRTEVIRRRHFGEQTERTRRTNVDMP